MIGRFLALLAIAISMGLTATTSTAIELLADPGFEDTRPLLPEDPDNSDPWRRTFFTLSPMATDAMVMPNNGLEHASLTKDHGIAGVDPQIDTSAFAGFGGAANVTDFTGLDLEVSVQYKVVENTVLDSAGAEPGTFIRMFLSYFGDAGFLGFGSFANADVFEAGTNDDYLTHSFLDTVPDFGSPVTSVAYNLAVLGQFGGSGAATVFFDDASLSIIPEPASISMFALALASLIALRRRGR